MLSPSGVRKVDSHTVAFHLDAPNANFPYLTCETTYQAIILPADYKIGTFTQTPQTTAAFQLTSYTPGVGATYEAFDGWWGGTPALSGVDATFYNEDAAVVAALLGGQLDLVGQINISTGRAVLKNPNVTVIPAHGASHRQVPIRTDIMSSPFHDYRVRQALALTLDRPAIVRTLFSGFADVGNDSPFAPVYPSTNKSVAQRHKNIRKARQLMAAAGHAKGFSVTLTTEKVGEIPQLAQIIQRSAKQIGINIKLKVLTSSAVLRGLADGAAVGLGHDAVAERPDQHHRLGPPAGAERLPDGGADEQGPVERGALLEQEVRLVREVVRRGRVAEGPAASYSKLIEQTLLHDTPVIFPYFYYYLQAASKNLKGYKGNAIGQTYLSRSSLA